MRKMWFPLKRDKEEGKCYQQEPGGKIVCHFTAVAAPLNETSQPLWLGEQWTASENEASMVLGQ
jgi:hypothetical protein